MPKDPTGELTGANPAYPAGMTLLDKLLPAMTDAEEEALLLKAIQQRHALGLTSVRDLSLLPGAMRTYFRLWQKGQLTLRVGMGLDLPDVARAEETLRGWGVGSRFGDAWLRLDSISEDPYPMVTPPRQFMEVALAANKYGWRLSPHVDGDDSLNAVLAAFEAADRASSIKEKRWVLEHVPLATTEQMDRMVKLGVVISSQYAAYAANLAPATAAVGRARAERQPPMRELLDHHLVVSAGSDFLGGAGSLDNPFIPIYFYVTRKTRNGVVIGPEQKISRQEALRVSTLNYAYTTFEEKLKGSIEPGKLADFLILSDDVLTVPEDRILSIRPLATYVGGRKVFAAPGGAF
jgi:predicted amidohydrolase YtcJ